MRPIQYEMDRLKSIVSEMFDLVKKQIFLSHEALIANQQELAGEIMRKENRVNSYELTIDRECEDILALQNPIANDLRFTISMLKISESLERIGDHAFGIAGYVYDGDIKMSKELAELVTLTKVYETIDMMFRSIIEALEKDDASIAKKVFKLDKVINKINKKIPKLFEEFAKKHDTSLSNLIYISRTVGKLERVGDLLTNIAEEVVFYYESEVLRHLKKEKKIKKNFPEVE